MPHFGRTYHQSGLKGCQRSRPRSAPSRRRRPGTRAFGKVLFETIRGSYYPQTSAIPIAMFVTVSRIDAVPRQ